MDNKIIFSGNITINNPSQSILNWCKRNLVISNPQYQKNLVYGYSVYNIAKKIVMYEQIGHTLKLPFGVWELIPHKFLLNYSIEYDYPRLKKVKFNANIPLFDYQQTAVRTMIDAKGGILVAPTGSGKTQCGIALITKLGMKALWITHTLDLVSQSKLRAEKYIDSRLLGEISGGKAEIKDGITFATVQSLASLDPSIYKYEFDVVIVDEVHRVAGSPTTLTMYYKVLNSISAPYKYGLTATATRNDDLFITTKMLIGDIVHKVLKSDVKNHIVPITVSAVYSNFKIGKGALNYDGTVNFTKLTTVLVEDELRNQLIVSNIPNTPTIILSQRVDHLAKIYNLLSDYQKHKAVIVTGNVPKKEREIRIDKVRNNEKSILLTTYALSKEGLDIPCLETLIFASPQKEEVSVVQSLGRVSRVYKGKTNAKVIDIVDNTAVFNKWYKERKRIYKREGIDIIE